MSHTSSRKIAQTEWKYDVHSNKMQWFQRKRIPKSKKHPINRQTPREDERKLLENIRNWMNLQIFVVFKMCDNKEKNLFISYELKDFQQSRWCFQIAWINGKCGWCGCFGGGYTDGLLLWHLRSILFLSKSLEIMRLFGFVTIERYSTNVTHARNMKSGKNCVSAKFLVGFSELYDCWVHEYAALTTCCSYERITL